MHSTIFFFILHTEFIILAIIGNYALCLDPKLQRLTSNEFCKLLYICIDV